MLYIYFGLQKQTENGANQNEKSEYLIDITRVMLLLIYSVLFFPVFDSLNSVFKCERGHHYLMKEMQCYQNQHIIMIILSIIGICLFVVINLMIAALYNETQPVEDDALARLDSNFELIMFVYRISMSGLTQFCFGGFCSWIIILVSLMSSIYFLFQYFKFLPYYNSAVSLTFGAMLGVYCWITLNALLMKIYMMSGHIIVICIGIPIVVYTLKLLREQKIEWLMSTNLDRLNVDIDCLNQIMTLQDWLKQISKSAQEIELEIKLKGFLNDHFQECTNSHCICSKIEEVYDQSTDKYLRLKSFGLNIEKKEEENKEEEDEELQLQNSSGKRIFEIHQSEVFLNNFIRQLYIDAVDKFLNSCSIHILFAYFYFKTMKNIHASLHELKIAQKKRPNLYQQFTIFRYQSMLEMYIKAENDKSKDAYEQLTNVKEFERIYSEMIKQIEKVCNHQVEFWTHLATVIPDLNYLNSQNNEIFDSADEADLYWQMLCKINPNYPQALLMYAEYQTFIRNNIQLGKDYYDKMNKINFGAALNEHNNAHIRAGGGAMSIGEGGNNEEVNRSDVLFSDEAVIVHISGNRESSGRMLKVSQGLKKCFGWDRQEINGQNISILMPNMFAQKHNQYLEQYYKTARKAMFNKERSLFAAHKTGYCFQVHLLIKQFPSLSEGIQYVGMIRPQLTDNDYIITDANGYIDSFTSGIGLLFNLNPTIIKDNSSINIQYIAPELMLYFNQKLDMSQDFDRSVGSENSFVQYKPSYLRGKTVGIQRTIENSKYSLPGGDVLTFYIPTNFLYLIKSQEHSVKAANRSKQSQRYLDNITNNASNMNVLVATHNTTVVSPTSVGGGNVAPGGTATNKQSPLFKDFIRYVQKQGKQGLRKMPEIKELINCPEYRNYDIKKSLSIEIREWIIPLGNSEDNGIKMLLFVIPKNQHERRVEDPLAVNVFEQANFTVQKNQEKEQQQTPEASQSVSIQQSKVENTDSKLLQDENMNMQGSQQLKTSKTNVSKFFKPQQLQKMKVKKKSTLNVGEHHNPESSLLPPQLSHNQQQRQSLSGATTFSLRNPLKSASTLEQASNLPATPQIPTIKQSGLESARDDQHKPNLIDEKSSQKRVSEFDLLQIERQETDEDEDDDQEQVDTERIDVKKDIALNDEMLVDATQNPSAISLKPHELHNSAKKKQTSSRASHQRLRPPMPEYVAQSFHKDDHAPNFESDIEQAGTTSRGGGNTYQAPLETDADQAKDDERDHSFSLDEDGEEYDEFDNDDDEDETEDLIIEDDNEDQGIRDTDVLDAGDAFNNSFGAKQQRRTQLQKTQQEEQSDEEEQQQMNFRQSRGSQVRSSRYGSRSSFLSPRSNRNHQGQRMDFSNQAHWAAMQIQSNKHLANQTMMNAKKGDYSRIVTNPKYKFFDEETCGSAYFNDCNASENEIDVRETIKRQQAKNQIVRKETLKRRKLMIRKNSIAEGGTTKSDYQNKIQEQKKKKKEKLDSLSRSGESRSSEANANVAAVSEVEEVGIEQSNVSGVDLGEGPHNDEFAEEQEEDDKQAQESTQVDQTQPASQSGSPVGEEMDISSVSSTASQGRVFFTLKQGIDEKFIPLQIRNLTKVANVVCLAILLLAIVYFIIQNSLFQNIQSYIEIIINSEKRIDEIMTINLKLNDIALINENILFNQLDEQVYISQYLQGSTDLKDSQTKLSEQTSSLPEASRKSINPTNVELRYFDTTTSLINTSYFFNIWEAIVQISVFSYRLSESPSLIRHNEPQFLFITENCMNSVLTALKESTQAIVNESDSTRLSNISIFLILLLTVSGALATSMAFLLPVIRRAKMNRQEVFELFTLKKVEKQVEEQLKKCRWFLSKYQSHTENQQDYDDANDIHLGMAAAAAAIEENAHIPGDSKGGSGGSGQGDYISKVKKQKKKKKPLDNNFLSLSLRLLFFLLAIEVFFLYIYLSSKSFLEDVSYLSRELRLLISRQPQLAYVLLMQKVLISSNLTQNFMFRPVREVFEEVLDTQNSEYQELLSLFQSNYNSHTSDYNSEFQYIMYNDQCEGLLDSELDACLKFDGGVLKKGLYSTVVNFWQDLTTINFDFMGSNRSKQAIKSFLNNKQLLQNQDVMENTLKAKHWRLVQVLKDDIDTAFSQQSASIETVFAFFILYLCLLYLFVWRLFMKGLLQELWRAKQCLSLLPVDICYKIDEIRSFIYRNSSAAGGSSGKKSS